MSIRGCAAFQEKLSINSRALPGVELAVISVMVDSKDLGPAVLKPL
jgi:hypothetical protein